MDVEEFRQSVDAKQPPDGLSDALQALWWDSKGDWEKAHTCVQDSGEAAGSHVHAYLHRKEGDQANANYWYRRANVEPSRATLDEEWESLVAMLLR